MSVAVIVPYAGECEYRAAAWEWIRSHYDGLEVVVGYGNPDRWRKGDAVADALGRTDADILVVADADCYADRTGDAIAAVAGGKARWAVPYFQVHRLTQTASEGVCRGVPLDRSLKVERHHDGILGGGIVIVERKLYEEAPIDRRFVGWGGEDHAFGYALQTFGGQPARLRGICWHLWHPSQPMEHRTGVSGSSPNEFLRLRYKAARDDRQLMARLIGDQMANATVTILRSTRTTDLYGDPESATVTEVDVPEAVVAPRRDTEIQARGRAGVILGLTAFLPPTVEIDHDDQVRVDGVVYDVDGEPGYWASAFSGTGQGIEVNLTRAEG